MTNDNFAYGKDKNFCEILFINKFGFKPHETGINAYGNCIYKIHESQKNYQFLEDFKAKEGLK